MHCIFFFSSRRRHTRWPRDWSSDVCSSDLDETLGHTVHAPARIPRILRISPREGAEVSTTAIHAGWAGDDQHGALVPPVYATSAYGHRDHRSLKDQIGRASCRERVGSWHAAGEVKDIT